MQQQKMKDMSLTLNYVYTELGLPKLINEKYPSQMNNSKIKIDNHKIVKNEKFKLIMENSKLIRNNNQQKFMKNEKLLKKRGTIYDDYQEDEQILRNSKRNYNNINNYNKITNKNLWNNDKELKCYINNRIKELNESRLINQSNLRNGQGNKQLDNRLMATTNNERNNNFNIELDF